MKDKKRTPTFPALTEQEFTGRRQTNEITELGRKRSCYRHRTYEQQQFTDANSRLPRNVSRRIVAAGGEIHWLGRSLTCEI